MLKLSFFSALSRCQVERHPPTLSSTRFAVVKNCMRLAIPKSLQVRVVALGRYSAMIFDQSVLG
jgi:hypothetical protein